MIVYLLTSAFLSFTGGILYMLWIRRYANSLQQKWFLYAIIASSLLIPITHISHPPQQAFAPGSEANPLIFSSPEISHTHLSQFCQCPNPNYTHRVHFRANAFYNFILSHRYSLRIFFFSISSLILLHLLWQVLCLSYLIYTSPKESRIIHGKRYRFLYPKHKKQAAAFQLYHRYIIWSQQLDLLSPQDQQAIIAHEISHLNQYNTAEKIFLSLLQCLWFWNPMLYFFRRDLDGISECLADQRASQAMGNKKQYAQLLLRMKTLQSQMLIQQFNSGSQLKKRLTRLFSQPKGSWSGWMLAIALLMLVEWGSFQYVEQEIVHKVQRFEVYQEVYESHPDIEEGVFCTDCHNVCYESN